MTRPTLPLCALALPLSVSLVLGGCASGDEWVCQITGEPPDAAAQLGCAVDFDKLASEPVDTSIPGARSVKTIVDLVDEGSLTFQDSVAYPTHYDYASTFLGTSPLPFVGSLAEFNQTEYTSPTRRFLLGAVTHYEGPDVYVYEIAPYDSADAAMVETAWDAITEHGWFGGELLFHPSSSAIDAVAAQLPERIGVITTGGPRVRVDPDHRRGRLPKLRVVLDEHHARRRGRQRPVGGLRQLRRGVGLDAGPSDGDPRAPGRPRGGGAAQRPQERRRLPVPLRPRSAGRRDPDSPPRARGARRGRHRRRR